MKNRKMLEKLGDFVVGRGFYIVLILCVATIGISGYYLVRTMTSRAGLVEPAGGSASVVLPDQQDTGLGEADALFPGLTGQEEQQTQQQPQSSAQEEPQGDDPEPAKQQTVADPPQEDKPVAIVYTWPVKGEVLRGFSLEVLSPDPTLEDWRTHDGLDIAAPVGVEVLAMGAGTVTEVFEDGLMGTTVVVDHNNGLVSTYCNLAQETKVAVGDTVEPGTILGTVGETAIAESGMSPHLHLETSLDGAGIDPLEYLPELP